MTPAVKTMPVVVATARWHLVLPDGRVRVCDTFGDVRDAAAAEAPGSAVRFVGHTDPPTSPLRAISRYEQHDSPDGLPPVPATTPAVRTRRPVAAGRRERAPAT